MISELASADHHLWLSILLKTFACAATLVAAGSAIVSAGLRGLSPDGRSALRRTAIGAALAAAILSVLRLPVQASFLMGGTLGGAADPAMLRIVAESPLGTGVGLRLIGLALVPALLLPGRSGAGVACLGAVLACVSFAFRGHSLGEPRLLLGALVTVHILGLAFWIGAFAPLARAAQVEPPAAAAALSREFGAAALWIVAALGGAGVGMLVLFGAATPTGLSTPYGEGVLVKLALVSGLLAFAARNRLRLTPDLASGVPGTAGRLRRSIAAEGVLVAAILALTATFTTLTSPPRDRTGALVPASDPAPAMSRSAADPRLGR